MLGDEDNSSVSLSLDVEQRALAAESDVLIDWTSLSNDAWGVPLTTMPAADRALLYHFDDMSLDRVLSELVDGSLSPTSVSLDVSCETTSSACSLSDFAFHDSHPIDVVERFRAGSGTWLLTLRQGNSPDDLAYLSLQPSSDSSEDVAVVTDRSSAGRASSDLGDLVPLYAGGHQSVDWSELTLDTRGLELHPYRLDRLVVARVSHEALDDVEAVVLDLEGEADELWSADVDGVTSFPLGDLVHADTGERGFPGFGGTDGWVLSLSCTSCGDPIPEFVTRMAD